MIPILAEALKNLCGVFGCMNSVHSYNEMLRISDFGCCETYDTWHESEKFILQIGLCEDCLKKLVRLQSE